MRLTLLHCSNGYSPYLVPIQCHQKKNPFTLCSSSMHFRVWRTAWFVTNACRTCAPTVSCNQFRLVSVHLWHSLNPNRLKAELKNAPRKIVAAWEKFKSGKPSIQDKFLLDMVQDFFEILDSITPDKGE